MCMYVDEKVLQSKLEKFDSWYLVRRVGRAGKPVGRGGKCCFVLL